LLVADPARADRLLGGDSENRFVFDLTPGVARRVSSARMALH